VASKMTFFENRRFVNNGGFLVCKNYRASFKCPGRLSIKSGLTKNHNEGCDAMHIMRELEQIDHRRKEFKDFQRIFSAMDCGLVSWRLSDDSQLLFKVELLEVMKCGAAPEPSYETCIGFHGTKKGSIEQILNEGFCLNGGEQTARAFGEGVYLTPMPNCAGGFTFRTNDEKFGVIFACRFPSTRGRPHHTSTNNQKSQNSFYARGQLDCEEKYGNFEKLFGTSFIKIGRPSSSLQGYGAEAFFGQWIVRNPGEISVLYACLVKIETQN